MYRQHGRQHTMQRILVIVWMPLAVSLPFFHVHPGTGHAFIDHDHIPRVHTIFHADVPAIHATRHHHANRGVDVAGHHSHHEWEHTRHELIHPELQFSTLQPSCDGIIAHWNQLMTHESNASLTPVAANVIDFRHTAARSHSPRISSRSPRSPPLP